MSLKVKRERGRVAAVVGLKLSRWAGLFAERMIWSGLMRSGFLAVAVALWDVVEEDWQHWESMERL